MKVVYILEEYFSGYDENGYNYYTDGVLENYRIFSNLDQANKALNNILKKNYKTYTKFFNNYDYANLKKEIILIEDKDFLEIIPKNASFNEIKKLIDNEKDNMNGEFPQYWLINIICKEIDN